VGRQKRVVARKTTSFQTITSFQTTTSFPDDHVVRDERVVPDDRSFETTGHSENRLSEKRRARGNVTPRAFALT
jgi:hypothetical protein